MQVRIRPLLLAAAALAGGASLVVEPVWLRDATFGDGPFRVTVGAIRAPLWSAAFAQGAGDVTLENVSLTFEKATHTLKSIRLSGVTSSRADIDALFDRNSAEPLSVRLSRINAREIAIPEIASELKPPLDQRMVYRNIVLQDVIGGVVRTATVGSVDIDWSAERKRMKASYGAMRAEETDLPAFARFYMDGGGNPSDPPKVVQRSFAGENIVVTDPKGLTMKIARIAGNDFALRPTAESFYTVMARASEIREEDKATEDERFRLAISAIDLLGAFQFGGTEMAGLEFSLPSEKGTATGRIARAAYAGRTADKPADFRVEGLEVKTADGSAKLDLISFTGFSFENTFAALRSMKDKPPAGPQDWDPATWRALIPTLGTIRYSGIAFDVPNDGAKQPGRVQFNLKDVTLTADRPINGIPTNVNFSIQNFAMPIPAESGADGLKELAAMGYRAIDMSWGFAANWNEATKEIALKDVSASGVDMGRASLSGVIANVAREAFDPDTTMAAISLLGATAKRVDLSVENNGLVERIIAAEAKKQKKTPDALRREFGSAAAVGIPLMLGNTDQAKALGQAVARFIAKPVRLRISATAKDAAGLGVADVLGAGDPAAVLRKLNVTAVAEDKS